MQGMIVDVNANISRWPFRRTPCDELPRLVETYRKFAVGQAWVGCLDGLFHRDIAGVNLRLVEACRQERQVELIPFGSVNPQLPDWQEDLRRCCEEHRMPGIRLHPNYHGYRLNEPVFAQLLDLAAQRGLIVQLVVRMEDVRVQHPLMRVADVDTKPLAELVRARSGLHLVLLNTLASVSGPALQELAAVDRIWFEIAMQEGVGGVAELLKIVPPARVLFGSHLPLFSLESAVLKMREAGLDTPRRQAIEHENARQLWSAITS
jgi:predicted TIM-barrel fold metal-dependent hydrolase